jgi:hypothetical protein
MATFNIKDVVERLATQLCDVSVVGRMCFRIAIASRPYASYDVPPKGEVATTFSNIAKCPAVETAG